MTKIGPSSGDAQEALPPSDFEQALEKQSHPSTLPTGRVEGKGGPQQPLPGGDRARQTLDKEYVQSKKDGYATNLWTAQVQVRKAEPICLAVKHFLMAKSLEEDNETDVSLVGTMINTVAGIDTEREDFDVNRFRFNDITATNEVIDVRRKVPATGYGMRTTMNVRIPMKKKIVFGVPLYAIYQCTALIEMQTSSITHDGTENDVSPGVSEVRPNIYVNRKDERELFVVRDAKELNQMSTYEMITPAPRIEIEYETKADYCPKYRVSFYIERNPLFSIIQTFMPMFAVVGLATINVFNGEGYGPALDNSIAIAFTLVLVLPELRPDGRGDTSNDWLSYFLSNNIAVCILFVGLLLTSLRFPRFFHDDAVLYTNETYIPFFNTRWEWAEMWGIGGLVLIWLSMAIPIGNYFRYRSFTNRIKETAHVHKTKPNKDTGDRDPWVPHSKRLAFCKDDSYFKWDVAVDKKDKGAFDLKTTCQLPNLVPVNDPVFTEHRAAGPGHMWTLANSNPGKVKLVAGPSHKHEDVQRYRHGYEHPDGHSRVDGGDQPPEPAVPTSLLRVSVPEQVEVDDNKTLVSQFEMLKRIHNVTPAALEAFKDKEIYLDTLLQNCGIAKPGDRLRMISVVKGVNGSGLPSFADIKNGIDVIDMQKLSEDLEAVTDVV